MIGKIIFLEIVSILALIYGLKRRREFKIELKESIKKGRFHDDILTDINGIIIAGIVGIVGGLIFFIKYLFGN